MSDTHERIPTPWPRLVQRLRYQAVPVVTLLISVLLAGWLWARRGGNAASVGEVNVVRLNINARLDGILADLPGKKVYKVFDTVASGETIARLDRSVIDAQIARFQSELDQMRTELEAQTKGGPATRPAVGGALKPGVPSVSPSTSNNADNAMPALDYVQSAAALRIGIAGHEARIRELEGRLLELDIKAPISGTIVQVVRMPGQAVQAGQPIMVIASEKGEYIVSYIRQYQPIKPTPGTPVEVRVRSTLASVQSKVISVGPQMELVPESQRKDVRVPEWGVPVHVEIPTKGTGKSEEQAIALRPGELVDLFFYTASADSSK